MSDENRASLERQDWIKAAYTVLTQEGVERVRVLTLAEKLGITRGSFYWHFKSRNELLQALIEVWQQKNTGELLAACASSQDFTDRMLAIADCWTNENLFDPALDAAMRNWGHHDANICQLVHEEDQKRLNAFQTMFKEHGCQHTEAMIRARVFYFTQVGYYALELGEALPARLKLYRDYFWVFTGEQIDETRFQQYLAKTLPKNSE
ncbi:TetR/AcrR family transcriptional regulator [Thiothrix eikelboomii]|uniref:Transcriptional regulator, TetR family n=1 Tax=Thiothrix eikelboomii TaxID=92487 RepID=A0A1T4XXV2_9GAMM|nr:TetR/AcrR family transcriptional regulator [Thiothrix eikelboomii]SKA93875.1 transcriptional regulator, TetR family [Thiothrix eikelboomii]